MAEAVAETGRLGSLDMVEINPQLTDQACCVILSRLAASVVVLSCLSPPPSHLFSI